MFMDSVEGFLEKKLGRSRAMGGQTSLPYRQRQPGERSSVSTADVALATLSGRTYVELTCWEVRARRPNRGRGGARSIVGSRHPGRRLPGSSGSTGANILWRR